MAFNAGKAFFDSFNATRAASRDEELQPHKIELLKAQVKAMESEQKFQEKQSEIATLQESRAAEKHLIEQQTRDTTIGGLMEVLASQTEQGQSPVGAFRDLSQNTIDTSGENQLNFGTPVVKSGLPAADLTEALGLLLKEGRDLGDGKFGFPTAPASGVKAGPNGTIVPVGGGFAPRRGGGRKPEVEEDTSPEAGLVRAGAQEQEAATALEKLQSLADERGLPRPTASGSAEDLGERTRAAVADPKAILRDLLLGAGQQLVGGQASPLGLLGINPIDVRTSLNNLSSSSLSRFLDTLLRGNKPRKKKKKEE